MSQHEVLTGRRVRIEGRAPARMASGRICAVPGCTTKLSSYNRHDTCYAHSPVRYPRVRGRTKII